MYWMYQTEDNGVAAGLQDLFVGFLSMSTSGPSQTPILA